MATLSDHGIVLGRVCSRLATESYLSLVLSHATVKVKEPVTVGTQVATFPAQYDS